jgi:integral membrane sensor domain MASE1
MLFAIFPVIVAFLSTAAGHNMYNESDSSSGGAALWLLMFTVPVGAIIVLIGAIMGFVRMVKSAKQNGASGASENRQSEE